MIESQTYLALNSYAGTKRNSMACSTNCRKRQLNGGEVFWSNYLVSMDRVILYCVTYRYPGVCMLLVNQGGQVSAVTPWLAGDCKADQNTFLTPPASMEMFHESRADNKTPVIEIMLKQWYSTFVIFVIKTVRKYRGRTAETEP